MTLAPLIHFDDIQRLLIVLPSWVGDTVMATPAIHALRHHPDLQNTQFIGYMRPGLDEILDGSQLIDECIVGVPSGIRGLLNEATRLRSQQFDAALLFPNSFRTAMMVAIAKIPTRVGYARDCRRLLLTLPIECQTDGGWKQPISAVEYYKQLVRYLDPAAPDCKPFLLPTQSQHNAATSILQSAGLAANPQYALLNPGANRSDKRWPAERFAQLASYLHTTYGLHILVNGSPAESDLITRICTIAGSYAINLTQFGITLGSLKALCKTARLIVTNDTGTRHIAAGVGFHHIQNADPTTAPHIISLFGPTAPEWSRLNYLREIEIATGGVEINQISLEQVTTVCTRILSNSIVMPGETQNIEETLQPV